MKSLFTLLCSFFLILPITFTAQSIVDCGTMEIETQTEKARLKVFNERIYKYLTQSNKLKNDTPFTLPIVVHVIQSSKNSGISDEQIKRGLQHLNDAFSNTGSYDRGEGVDTKICFQFVQRT
ncbi:MAG: hypothetical protein AAFO82_17985, partial [Bacteroidota bacterium]